MCAKQRQGSFLLNFTNRWITEISGLLYLALGVSRYAVSVADLFISGVAGFADYRLAGYHISKHSGLFIC